MKPWSGIEILGAMFVIAPIRTLAGEGSRGEPTRFLPRRINAVKNLIRWFNGALRGIGLEKSRAKKPPRWPAWAKGKILSQIAEEERALWLLSNVLPDSPRSKEKILKDLKRICRQITNNKEVSVNDWKKLHEFCRKFSDHLDKLRAERAGY